MRALISTVAAGLAFAMFAAHANAGPIIRPGQAAKLPAGCSVNGNGLDCTASASTAVETYVRLRWLPERGRPRPTRVDA